MSDIRFLNEQIQEIANSFKFCNIENGKLDGMDLDDLEELVDNCKEVVDNANVLLSLEKPGWDL